MRSAFSVVWAWATPVNRPQSGQVTSEIYEFTAVMARGRMSACPIYSR